MISMALQRDVPQYMAIPWLMTNVMARTISAIHTRHHDKVLALCSSCAGGCITTYTLKLITFHRAVDVISVGKDDVHVVQLEP